MCVITLMAPLGPLHLKKFQKTLILADIEQGALIREKSKVAQNEKQKKQLWVFVYMYKIWQILKRFTRAFHHA